MNRPRTDWLVIHRCETDFEDYHCTVARDGTVTWHMDREAHGAAVRNFNSVAISIGVVGDFCTADAAKALHGTPTPEQWAAAVVLAASLLQQYPGAKVTGHTELGPGATMYVEKLSAPLSCPGTRFPMDKFRTDVAAIVSRQGP